eukprot:4696940-Pyramimonas_sp.AAC.1
MGRLRPLGATFAGRAAAVHHRPGLSWIMPKRTLAQDRRYRGAHSALWAFAGSDKWPQASSRLVELGAQMGAPRQSPRGWKSYII